MSTTRNEARVIWLMAAMQFVNMMNFSMVMPLGPDFAKALGIANSQIGYVGGAYTLAAALSAFLCARVVDRYDRKAVALFLLGGLSVATLATLFADSLGELLAARILAGLFGGPITSIGLSIVTDTVPVERRGRAVGTVMGAFSAASVLGVPLALELSHRGGWHLPFYAVSAFGALVWLILYRALPAMGGHLAMRPAGAQVSLARLLARNEVRNAYLMVSSAMFAGFLLIPNFSSYFQFNLHYPREHMGLLLFTGGLASLVIMPLAGRLSDRVGGSPLSLAATVALVTVIYLGFTGPAQLPVLAISTLFMALNAVRNITATATSTRVPAPYERAGYMALQSALTYVAIGGAALLSSLLLGDRADGSLIGMPALAWLAIAIAVLQPLLMARLERRLRLVSQPA
ncbi:MAG TPA: MFS transporter [Candidatus Competibacteraceae bacterium]|nr:MFS transporter [Candidatus Competibacteraceae bacterium]